MRFFVVMIPLCLSVACGNPGDGDGEEGEGEEGEGEEGEGEEGEGEAGEGEGEGEGEAPPCVDQFEENNTFETAVTMPAGTIRASMCGDQFDFYIVPAPVGCMVDVVLEADEPSADLDLWLYAPDQQLLDLSGELAGEVDRVARGVAVEGMRILVENVEGPSSAYSLTAQSICIDNVTCENAPYANEQPDFYLPTDVIVGALCGDGESNEYLFVAPESGGTLTVDVLFDAGAGDVTVSILSQNGDFTLDSETNATGSIRLDFVTSGESFLRARVSKTGPLEIGYQLTKIAPQ
jgi:hypothetical protein